MLLFLIKPDCFLTQCITPWTTYEMCSGFISSLMFGCIYSGNKNVELFWASLNDAFISAVRFDVVWHFN